MITETTANAPVKHRLSGLQVLLVVLATIIVTVGVPCRVLRAYLFPAEFRPVELSVQEEQVLKE